MASAMMEELEIKEPTPSLAPSQYESPLYTKKWRIILAVLLGVTLMGLCILGFYVSVKARGAADEVSAQSGTTTTTTTLPPRSSSAWWRTDPSGGTCFSLVNDTCPKVFSTPPLLVVGLDGLRPDRLKEDVTPALVYLRKCGATAQSLVPSYPTNTFPNMYTIATGLYPESHGVVDNRMHDPVTNKDFNLNDSVSILNPVWWGGEPIWNTVTKQGKKSGTVHWPGSDVAIHGRYPVYFKSYSTSMSFEERVSQMHAWLMQPEHERPHLMMVYFEEPMQSIRKYGPSSIEAKEALVKIDEMVDELMNYIYKNKLAHCINVMVVSDHGVAPVSCSNNFYLETFISNIEAEAYVYTGAVGRLRVKSNDKKKEREILEKLRCKNPKVRALPKALLPRRYHYAHNQRIEDVILDTSPNTRVVTNSESSCRKADHGYNNLAPSMQATFIGFGPDFKVNKTSKSFRNVELYNLMCQLLHITPASNNGTKGSLDDLLQDPPPFPASSMSTPLPEKVLPPPDGMLRPWNSEECHCFTPKAEDKPVVESLVRIRRNSSSSDGSNTSGDSSINSGNRINNTDSPGSSNSNDNGTSSISNDNGSSSSTSNDSGSRNSPDNTITTTATSTSTTTPAPTTTHTATTLTPAVTSSSTTTAAPPSTTTTTVTSTTTTPATTTSTTPTTTTSTTTTPTTTTSTTTTPTTTTSTTTTPTTTTSTTTTPRSRTEAELSQLLNTHVPWGSPGLSLTGDIGGNLNVLLHSSYVIGLHETLNLGVWTSFTLNNLTLEQLQEEESRGEPQPAPCWRADPRLERLQNDQCQRMLTEDAFHESNITLIQLFPQELETKELLQAEGYLLSNLAAVKAGYLVGAHRAMVKALMGWTTSFGAINVVHGPVFDDDLDGHQDSVAHVLDTVKPLVPSDYFFVISQCGSATCPDIPMETLAFVFPNTQFHDNCLTSDSEYLNYHLTNVRDVELLTGLQFFRNVYDQAAVELRTVQPLAIWPLPSTHEARVLSLLNDRMGKADTFSADYDTQPM